MATATKALESKTVTDKDGFTVIPTDVTSHEADMARRQARRDANRDEQIRCCSYAYSAARELEKPAFEFLISAEWLGKDGDEDFISMLHSEQTVIAQNEADAWAAFCDKLGRWPSRRQVKPKIVRGEQLSAARVAVWAQAGVDSEASAKGIVPRKTIGPKPKKRNTM